MDGRATAILQQDRLDPVQGDDENSNSSGGYGRDSRWPCGAGCSDGVKAEALAIGDQIEVTMRQEPIPQITKQ
jgi:hypothetical protein